MLGDLAISHELVFQINREQRGVDLDYLRQQHDTIHVDGTAHNLECLQRCVDFESFGQSHGAALFDVVECKIECTKTSAAFKHLRQRTGIIGVDIMSSQYENCSMLLLLSASASMVTPL